MEFEPKMKIRTLKVGNEMVAYTFAIGFVAPFDKANTVLSELSQRIKYGVQGVHSVCVSRERERERERGAIRSVRRKKLERRKRRPKIYP